MKNRKSEAKQTTNLIIKTNGNSDNLIVNKNVNLIAQQKIENVHANGQEKVSTADDSLWFGCHCKLTAFCHYHQYYSEINENYIKQGVAAAMAVLSISHYMYIACAYALGIVASSFVGICACRKDTAVFIKTVSVVCVYSLQFFA